MPWSEVAESWAASGTEMNVAMDRTVTEPSTVIGVVESNTIPLAVFDLDGTLVKRDTFLPFMMTYSLRRRRFWPLMVMPFWVLLYVCRLVSDRTAKEKLIKSFFRGQPIKAIRQHSQWFTRTWLPRHMREDVVAKLHHHLEVGHRVIMLSASPDLYVPVIAEFLGIREVICTRVAASDEICHGDLVGGNCKGVAKLTALKDYLGLESAPHNSSAYGDSASDRHVLNWVQYGFLV